ncbi:hypothetical protein WH47_07261 [Habropoda laboriosa]|uniref:Neurogenic protein mastermind n=1 Tax=Habropoda laboriosa TaxID=597456 RepID=A0A0L7R5M7_9HYME|nr:hypothetical protein WH47_07261 [Habropoda laboriosa]
MWRSSESVAIFFVIILNKRINSILGELTFQHKSPRTQPNLNLNTALINLRDTTTVSINISPSYTKLIEIFSISFQQQKFVKRTAEELEPAGGGSGDGGFGEPPVKLQCTQAQHQHQQGPGGGGGGNLVECKQEPDNEFVDLEQCAAALEKDAAANGAGFPGFSDFMGDDTGDEIITSDAFKDLISEISDFHPEFMKDFDFEEKIPVDALANNAAVAAAAAAAANNNNNNNNNNSIGTNNGQIKMEDDKDSIHQQHGNANSNSVNNGTATNNGNANVPANSSPGALGSAQYSPARLTYSGLDFKSEMSPAAQTLKQMAEQHQHKSQQLGLGGFNPGAAAAAAARGPTAPQQTNDMFVGSQTQFATGLADMKRPQPTSGGKPSMLGPSGGYKQQYSPYGSPGSMPNHGSPGYPLPPRGSQGGGPNQTGSQGPFTSSTPPRPPSGPGTSTLQINQAQQLHINNPGHQIQVSGYYSAIRLFCSISFISGV